VRVALQRQKRKMDQLTVDPLAVSSQLAWPLIV
jgi:hypothetical protein